MELRDRYTPKELALGLMKGDPATFKAGYTAANAALAAQDVFGLSDAETAELRRELEPAIIDGLGMLEEV